MSAILTLARKETRDAFSSPVAAVFLTVFLFLSYWLFFDKVFVLGQTTLRGFFLWMPILFIVFLPAVTMGLWSDEKRSGTAELLLTLPVGDAELVLGKYLSALSFLTIVLLLTLPLPIAFSFLGDLDQGQVLGSYLGIFFLGATYLAFGLFVSSLTRNPIVAFLTSVLALFVFYILAEPVVTDHLPALLVPVIQYASFYKHFESLGRGVIDSRDVLYFVSVSGLFLYGNVLSLGARRVS